MECSERFQLVLQSIYSNFHFLSLQTAVDTSNVHRSPSSAMTTVPWLQACTGIQQPSLTVYRRLSATSVSRHLPPQHRAGGRTSHLSVCSQVLAHRTVIFGVSAYVARGIDRGNAGRRTVETRSVYVGTGEQELNPSKTPMENHRVPLAGTSIPSLLTVDLRPFKLLWSREDSRVPYAAFMYSSTIFNTGMGSFGLTK